MCSSSSDTILTSSAIMHSSMSVYDSFAMMVIHMTEISSSLFASWLCLDN